MIRLFYLAVIIGVLFSFTICAQSPSFGTYINPVIPGDHPDATLTRVGNDYYTTGSSFNVTPVIYHSTDLVHWEAIAQPVSASWLNFGNTPGGGTWGGHMVFYKGKYWHFFSRSNTMYFVNAVDPAGPWSQPVLIKNPVALPYGLGYDNSIFIDDDQKWYLIVKNGQPNNGIIELGDDGQPSGAIYNLSWLNPSPYPYSWAEGPVMWKAHGYYYYSFARDLSGGQKVMRSTVLTDVQSSWEMLGDLFSQNDPLKAGSLFTEPNHCSPVVMLNDSTSWLIHPLYAKGEWKGQGRQGLLNRVGYNQGKKPTTDYPVNKYFQAPALPSHGIPWMVPKSDFFDASGLNPEWSFIGYTSGSSWSLTDRPGWLRLSPKNSTTANTIVKNDGEHGYSLITHLDFDATSTSDEAGLRIIRGDETKKVRLYSGFASTGEKIIGFSFDSYTFTVPNQIGNDLWLKMVRSNHYIYGYFSGNGVTWTQIGTGINISVIDSYSDFTSFTGTRQGLYVQHKPAFFDLYLYRDAYTAIQANSYANQYGIIQSTGGMIDSIHHNDWILFAGVEFGTSTYAKKADSIYMTVSALSAGVAEIWLDSIETGFKAGNCEIVPTGGLNTYGISKAAVFPVTGTHDVYVRFTGNSRIICRFKSLQFTAKNAPHFISAGTFDANTIKVKLDKAVKAVGTPSGFSIVCNTLIKSIDSIAQSPEDSSELWIRLHDTIQFGDQLLISYDSGNVKSVDGFQLVYFFGKPITNNLPDPYPHLLNAHTNVGGDTLYLQFNDKMVSLGEPLDDFHLFLSGNEISIKSIIHNPFDSAILWILPDNRVYAEDLLTLTYNGSSLHTVNHYALQSFQNYGIVNDADGYPPVLIWAKNSLNDTKWNRITLKFDRNLADVSTQQQYFMVSVNDVIYPVISISGNKDSICLALENEMVFGDVILVSYAGGAISSINNGLLQEIHAYPVQNNVPVLTHIDFHENGNIRFLYRNKTLQIYSGDAFKSLKLFNAEGKLIYDKRYAGENHEAIFGLDEGIYLIQMTNLECTRAFKIIAR